MPRRPLSRSPAPRRAALLVGVLAGAFALPGALAAQTPNGCERCHGELELLRQHVPTLEDARALLVLPDTLAASAHGSTSCVACHSGFRTFPHTGNGTTATCASCHEEQDTAWQAGSHAVDDNAMCADCHGVHDVLSVEDMHEAAGVEAMRGVCGSCHFEPRIPPDDPHADSVSCAGCHAPHGTLPPTDPDAQTYAANQASTCGACHQDEADLWARDSHGQAVRALTGPDRVELDGATGSEPPTCSACHGAHGMLAPSHERFDQDMVNQCAVCHEDYAETYYGTYHGKATELGSEVVATCDRCHGSHDIYPASNDSSQVSEAQLVETCAQCHEQARPEFVAYDSHPDPMNRDRNPPLYFSFVFMNTLLIGVLGLFALHTGLWWLRLFIDKQKGIVHGIGEDHA